MLFFFLNIRLIQLCRYNEDKILVVAVILGKKKTQRETKERDERKKHNTQQFTIRVSKKFLKEITFIQQGHI